MTTAGSFAPAVPRVPVEVGQVLRLVPAAADPARIAVSPHTGLHPWFPLSPCGAGCVDIQRDTVSAARAAGRLIRAALLAAGAACAWPTLLLGPGTWRSRFLALVSRQLLVALGLRVEIDDRRAAGGPFAGLVVANHISYLDIAAITGVRPARFVAKAEIACTPGTAVPAKIFRPIPVERNSLRQLPATVGVVTERLGRGRSVAVFPEGTTRCGVGAGTFAPAFFQAAIDAQVPVLPIALSFTTVSGTCVAAAFIGDDTPWDTLRRVLRTRGLTVRVTVHDAQAPGTDRRELAKRCERLIAVA